MTHEGLDLAQRLHQAGLRMTPQRQIVLDSLCAAGPHATAEEIFQRVREAAPSVDRATVYRTLSTLEEIAIVDVTRVHGKLVYEISGERPHHHLVCRRCGKMIELTHEPFSHLYHSLQEMTGFQILDRHLSLTGLCPACQGA